MRLPEGLPPHRRSSGEKVGESPEYVYTLALAQLFNGKPEDCERTLAIGLEMDQPDPSGLAWLVQGEMMKRYSLDEAASLAFEHAQSQGFGDLAFARLLLRN